MKIVRIWNYSGPHFPAFGLNTERCGVYLRIQFANGKIQTRITPNTDAFHAVLNVKICYNDKTFANSSFMFLIESFKCSIHLVVAKAHYLNVL